MYEVEISEDLESMIPKFMRNREEEFLKIIELLSSGNKEEIKAVAHKIKGVSGGYGFNKLTEIGAEIEDIALDEKKERIEELCKAGLDYLKNVKITYVEEEF